MKEKAAPAAKRRYLKGVEERDSLELLHDAAQTGWIPRPQFTESCVDDGVQSMWATVCSVPGHRPGVAVSFSRKGAQRQAADKVAPSVRLVLNVCPVSGRDCYPSAVEAWDAVDTQQLFGLGKPLTQAFKCKHCTLWHTSGKGASVEKRRRQRNSAKSEGQPPWSAKPCDYEVTTAPTGERVVVVRASLGNNAPNRAKGMPVALVLRQKMLAGMLAALESGSGAADLAGEETEEHTEEKEKET